MLWLINTNTIAFKLTKSLFNNNKCRYAVRIASFTSRENLEIYISGEIEKIIYLV